MNLLYLGIGINPIGSSKIKFWHFHAKLINLSITPGTVSTTNFSGVLTSLFDTIPLYSFKAKVLRVLFQLESPNSEYRNSSYVRNNPDYSMFKAGTRIWLAHGPTLSKFLCNLGSEFGDAYSLSFVPLEVYFT